MIILSFLIGLVGCKYWIKNIPLDDNSNNTDQQDENPEDSAEDSAEEDSAEDTGPAPPCPLMEEEPNGSYDEAQSVGMETWVCGTFEELTDLDVFAFNFPEEGWLQVWVRAQDLGSSADLMVSLKSGSQTALSTFNGESTDPLLIVPVNEAKNFYVAIQEQFNSHGENHFWEALFSQIKAPINYNLTEDESEERNDGFAAGVPVEDGTRIMGIMDSNFDRDWYTIDLPEGSHEITLAIDAHAYGSPIDLEIYLYPPEALEDSTENYVVYRNNGLNPNSLDPYLTHTVDRGGTWGVLLKTYNSTGSEFYWYVLDVTVESEQTEETE